MSAVESPAPTPTSPMARIEQAMQTTLHRAKTLFADGYTIDPDPDRAGVYVITTPLRTRKGKQYRNCYEVDLAHRTCDCEMFQFSEASRLIETAGCKHLIATDKAIAEAARLAAPLFAGKRNALDIPARPSTNAKPDRYSAYSRSDSGDSARAQFDGGMCDALTGEVIEEDTLRTHCAPPAPSPVPVRVFPRHGSEEWLRQMNDDFGD